MSKKQHRLRQNRYKLLINLARDSKGAKGAICGDHAIEFSVFAFLDELSAVGGLCGYEIGNIAEGLPGFAGAVMYVRINSVVDGYFG
jgi:hypothetical protein